ncbi:MAG: NfeD-like protein [Oscillospiraceae bacterium]|nr:NfeD-like protein [Oscillospiraceae bacterium]
MMGIQQWWNELSDILRVLYCIAIPATLVLVLQLLLTMIGGHGGGDVDISDTSGIDGLDGGLDLDGNGIADALETDASQLASGTDPGDFGSFKLLTVQTIVTFLAVFGWVSIICVSAGMTTIPSVLIGAVCGAAMMLLVAKMVQASRKLVENGALDLKNAIGETATVYLTVPPKNGGSGKITMQLQGRFCEFDAVNAGEAPLKTGTQVVVTDVLGDALVVETP